MLVAASAPGRACARHPGPGPVLALAVLLAALPLTGCIASEGTQASLSVSDGSGEFIIYLVVEQGQVVRNEAWWVEDAPQLEVEVASHVPGWEAIVLKNDVVLDRAELLGTPGRAFLLWRSGAAATVATPGDAFEVIVVNGTADETVGRFNVAIER